MDDQNNAIQNQIGRPPTKKAARKKLTIMMMEELSHSLKMESMVNKKSVSDYIEDLLCEKFDIDKDTLYNHINIKKKATQKTFVYLMKDNSNGYTKIGYSKKPKHRERTLQAQRPTVELIWKKEGTLKNERQLHELFAHRRLRGEWFNLTRSDIELIKNYKFKN